MRKLMFTAAAALVFAPVAAFAAANEQPMYTTQSYKTERIVKSVHDFNKSPGRAIFDLGSGQQLVIEEQVAYKVDPDGYTYFAPSSEYKTASGYTVVVDSGRFHHIEEPMEGSLYLEQKPEGSDSMTIRRPENIRTR